LILAPLLLALLSTEGSSGSAALLSVHRGPFIGEALRGPFEARAATNEELQAVGGPERERRRVLKALGYGAHELQGEVLAVQAKSFSQPQAVAGQGGEMEIHPDQAALAQTAPGKLVLEGSTVRLVLPGDKSVGHVGMWSLNALPLPFKLTMDWPVKVRVIRMQFETLPVADFMKAVAFASGAVMTEKSGAVELRADVELIRLQWAAYILAPDALQSSLGSYSNGLQCARAWRTLAHRLMQALPDAEIRRALFEPTLRGHTEVVEPDLWPGDWLAGYQLAKARLMNPNAWAKDLSQDSASGLDFILRLMNGWTPELDVPRVYLQREGLNMAITMPVPRDRAVVGIGEGSFAFGIDPRDGIYRSRFGKAD